MFFFDILFFFRTILLIREQLIVKEVKATRQNWNTARKKQQMLIVARCI